MSKPTRTIFKNAMENAFQSWTLAPVKHSSRARLGLGHGPSECQNLHKKTKTMTTSTINKLII
jgi:hypothetical protein